MSTFNQPLFNDPGGNLNTIDEQPSFPELYIREFLNDLGVLPLELTPLSFQIETFIVIGTEVDFTVTQTPSKLFSPIVYLNGSPQYKDSQYTILDRVVSFPEGILVVGDIIKVRYVY